jgi:hypothetical protein
MLHGTQRRPARAAGFRDAGVCPEPPRRVTPVRDVGISRRVHSISSTSVGRAVANVNLSLHRSTP